MTFPNWKKSYLILWKNTENIFYASKVPTRELSFEVSYFAGALHGLDKDSNPIQPN
jgi:hypothetical protein